MFFENKNKLHIWYRHKMFRYIDSWTSVTHKVRAGWSCQSGSLQSKAKKDRRVGGTVHFHLRHFGTPTGGALYAIQTEDSLEISFFVFVFNCAGNKRRSAYAAIIMEDRLLKKKNLISREFLLFCTFDSLWRRETMKQKSKVFKTTDNNKKSAGSPCGNRRKRQTTENFHVNWERLFLNYY